MKVKLVLGVLFGVWAILGFFQPAEAAGYSYTVSSRITVKENLSTTVQTVISATAESNTAIPQSLDIPLYGTNVTALAAVDGEGGSLPSNSEDDFIRLRLNTIQARESERWSADVSYSSTLGVAIGQSTIFMLPSFDYGETNVTEETITLISSGELGPFVTRGMMPSETSTIGGEFVSTWQNQNGPIENSVGLLFGDQALADVTFARTLENKSFWWQTQEIVLPPDTNQQRVFLDSISPAPTNVRLDTDGNVIVAFRLSPRQSLDVSASLQIAANNYVYDLESEALLNDYDQTLVERYTQLNGAWQDGAIEFTGETATTPVTQVVEDLYDQVSQQTGDIDGDTGYQRSINRSNQLIGELRATGIPARLVVGAAFGDGSRSFATPQPHAWVEVNIPSVGWITLDPSFEQYGEYFGIADVQRVGLALRGFDPEFPPENSQFFRIDFLDEAAPPVPEMKPELSGTKYMILPGLTLDMVSVKMPSGVIADRVGVAIGPDQPIALGSLAPLQTVTIRSTSLLGNAFTAESLQYGIVANGALDSEQILAQGDLVVSYIPMIVLLAILGFAVMFKRYIWPRWQDRRSSKKATKQKKKKQQDVENVDMLAALDVPELAEAEPERDEPPDHPPMQPADDRRGEENTPPPAHSAMKPKPKPTTETAQAPTVTHMNLGGAQMASPEDIRREIARKRPKKLIQ